MAHDVISQECALEDLCATPKMTQQCTMLAKAGMLVGAAILAGCDNTDIEHTINDTSLLLSQLLC